jgi:hypothetical protein
MRCGSAQTNEARTVSNRAFMPWQLQYASETETVVVTTHGHLSDAEARDLTLQAFALLRRTHATRVLGDLRAMESAPSLAAIYWLVHDYASLGANGRARIAVVEPRKPKAHAAIQFYTTVCANQRYQAQLFPSNEAAQAWLGSATPA